MDSRHDARFLIYPLFFRVIVKSLNQRIGSVILNIQRINPCRRWSDITVFNGIAHFVEVADSDASADIKGQVKQIFSQAEQALEKIGSSRSHVLSLTLPALSGEGS